MKCQLKKDDFFLLVDYLPAVYIKSSKDQPFGGFYYNTKLFRCFTIQKNRSDYFMYRFEKCTWFAFMIFFDPF